MSIPGLPSSPSNNSGNTGCLMQFCIRDAPAARLDAQRALQEVRGHLDAARGADSEVKALLMLGSLERGSKVFRFKVQWDGTGVLGAGIWAALLYYG